MVSKQLETYRADKQKLWITAIGNVIGVNSPGRSQWTDINQMVSVLDELVGDRKSHLYLPTGGGIDPTAVRIGREKNTIEVTQGPRAAYIFKPTQLSINYFADAPGQSFVYIHCATMKPSGIYEDFQGAQEELVETAPLNYHERYVWDQGYFELDEYGDEVPLPAGSRLALRFLKGNFLLAGNGSFWNGTANTYDGEHDRYGENTVREVIERLIAEKSLSG